MMSVYTGSKIIKARPMTRAEYNDYRGWDVPDSEDGDETGFLVEYVDGGEPNHPDHTGYISWSPTSVFETAYTVVGTENDLAGIESFKLRMKAELSALRENIAKLNTFIQSPSYKHASIPTRELLKSQLLAMLTYAAILESRLLLG
jgi:hypothetical protein